MTIRFYREDNKWYADIAEQDGFTKEDMQMVEGSDSLCEIIAQGEDEIFVTLDTELLKTSTTNYKTILIKESEDEFGAWYRVHEIHGVFYDFSAWLCPVAKWLFGEYPYIIRLDY